MARLQSEFCTKDFFRATNFLTKNAPKFSPNILSLCSVGQKKSRKIPSKFPTKFSKFSCEKSPKKFTDELLQERRKNVSLGWHTYSGPVLRDTARLSQRYPPIARYGVFGVSTWPIGCDTPPPFQSISPLESIREVEVRYPPLKRGISAILARYPMKTRQMGAIPPCAILSRKGIAR